MAGFSPATHDFFTPLPAMSSVTGRTWTSRTLTGRGSMRQPWFRLFDMTSALYSGTVVHQRFKPRGHRLRYRLAQILFIADPFAATVRQSCDKAFYVSPFMRMDMTYTFNVAPPDETAVVVLGDDARGRVITASFTGPHQDISDIALIFLLLRHGLLSLKVRGAINWEALKLWAKGLRIQQRPSPPEHPVTVVTIQRG
jgi:DUF1365 family protein